MVALRLISVPGFAATVEVLAGIPDGEGDKAGMVFIPGGSSSWGQTGRGRRNASATRLNSMASGSISTK
jgi:hypothetical protein